MKKCIVFTRVSTEHQHLSEQELKVSNLASSDGYSVDRQILISYKESAIKLSEEERQGLIELKQKIESDSDIDSVYVFDLSRISRKQKILYSIRDFLIDRQIQLVCLTPMMRLLDSQGKIDPTAELAFSLFSVMAEQEMRLKKERVAAGRERSKREGRFHGGPHPGFGFEVDEKSRLIRPDLSKTGIIIEMFEKYVSGYSVVKLRKWLEDRGIRYTAQNIKEILVRPSLRELVGPELFDRASAERHLRKKAGEDKHRKYSICEGLIRCPHCGRFYTWRSNGHYNCVYHDVQRKGTDQFCHNSVGLSAARIDAILIECAAEFYNKRMAFDSEEREKMINEKMRELPVIIKALDKKMASFTQKIERIVDNYENNLIGKEKRDEKVRKVREDELEVSKQLANKVSELNYYKDLKKQLPIMITLNIFESVDKMTQEELYFLVHENIESVKLEINQQEKIVTVYGKSGDTRKFAFVGQARGFHLYQIMKDGRIDVTNVKCYRR